MPMYCSVPGKHLLLGNHPRTFFFLSSGMVSTHFWVSIHTKLHLDFCLVTATIDNHADMHVQYRAS